VFVSLMLGSKEIEATLIPAKIRPTICADPKQLRQAILLAHPLDCYSGFALTLSVTWSNI
jgi:hypothetical protein